MNNPYKLFSACDAWVFQIYAHRWGTKVERKRKFAVKSPWWRGKRKLSVIRTADSLPGRRSPFELQRLAGVPGLGCYGVRTSSWAAPTGNRGLNASPWGKHPGRVGRRTAKDFMALGNARAELPLQGKKQPTDTGKCQGDLLVVGENVCWKMGIIVRAAWPRKGWDVTCQNLNQLL